MTEPPDTDRPFNVRRGVVGGAVIGLILSISAASTSDRPVRTFLFVAATVATCVLLTVVVAARRNRSR